MPKRTTATPTTTTTTTTNASVHWNNFRSSISRLLTISFFFPTQKLYVCFICFARHTATTRRLQVFTRLATDGDLVFDKKKPTLNLFLHPWFFCKLSFARNWNLFLKRLRWKIFCTKIKMSLDTFAFEMETNFFDKIYYDNWFVFCFQPHVLSSSMALIIKRYEAQSQSVSPSVKQRNRPAFLKGTSKDDGGEQISTNSSTLSQLSIDSSNSSSFSAQGDKIDKQEKGKSLTLFIKQQCVFGKNQWSNTSVKWPGFLLLSTSKGGYADMFYELLFDFWFVKNDSFSENE